MSRFFGGCALVLTLNFAGCGEETTATPSGPAEIVAFDQNSRQAILVLGDVTLPMANPANPNSQLQPALYCSTCQRWFPTPPLEKLNHTPGAAQCLHDGTPLIIDGPPPEQRLQLKNGNQR